MALGWDTQQKSGVNRLSASISSSTPLKFCLYNTSGDDIQEACDDKKVSQGKKIEALSKPNLC